EVVVPKGTTGRLNRRARTADERDEARIASLIEFGARRVPVPFHPIHRRTRGRGRGVDRRGGPALVAGDGLLVRLRPRRDAEPLGGGAPPQPPRQRRPRRRGPRRAAEPRRV